MVANHKDIQQRFRSLSPFLDERMRRLVAAAESAAIGYGGVSAVARATGVSRRAIGEGIKELKRRKSSRPARSAEARIRRKGGGRKRTVDKDPTLREDLDRLLDPATRGDPECPLRWTCKSVRKLAEQLQQQGHAVSYQTVAELLHAMDYSLQANQKTLEGSRHADRDQQFKSLVSGYKSNRFNWLEIPSNFSWDSASSKARKMGTFSNSVTLRTCRIWCRLGSSCKRFLRIATST